MTVGHRWLISALAVALLIQGAAAESGCEDPVFEVVEGTSSQAPGDTAEETRRAAIANALMEALLRATGAVVRSRSLTVNRATLDSIEVESERRRLLESRGTIASWSQLAERTEPLPSGGQRVAVKLRVEVCQGDDPGVAFIVGFDVQGGNVQSHERLRHLMFSRFPRDGRFLPLLEEPDKLFYDYVVRARIESHAVVSRNNARQAGAISRFLPGAAPVPVSARESLRVDVVLEAVPFMGDMQHVVSKSAERELGAGERLDTVMMELVSSAVWDGMADLYRQMLSAR